MDFEKIKTIYNLDFIFEYKDNNEYRNCLRELFFMNPIDNSQLYHDIDTETLDEMDYDEFKISETMDVLLNLTQDNHYFRELYSLAAALMFSEDYGIGQAVLFSYDNLPLFHNCLASFIREPESFNENNIFYLNLKKKLT
jgi:hypothetical protein